MRISIVGWVVFAAFFVNGCGGGGGGSKGDPPPESGTNTVVIQGQATLGSLSGAVISIETAEGAPIASVVAAESVDPAIAGTFRLEVDPDEIPAVVVVSATGGTDIDPTDTGVYGSPVQNQGRVHAVLTKDQLTAGRFTINPITEMIFQRLAMRHPEGISGLPAAQIESSLDAKAVEYLEGASGYGDALQFLPARDKAASRIDWDAVLETLVRGIHQGNRSIEIQTRVALLGLHLEPTGIQPTGDGTGMSRVEAVGNTRILTRIGRTDAGLIAVLQQDHADPSGALIRVRSENGSGGTNFAQVSVAIEGHKLELKGATGLLSGEIFSEAGLASVSERLIRVERIENGDLTLSIDPSLLARVSDNNLTFSVNGRTPLPGEIEIISDNPKIRWRLSTTNQYSREVAGTLEGNVTVLSDGTIIKELTLEEWNTWTDAGRRNWETIKSFAGTVLGLSSGPAGPIWAFLTNEGKGVVAWLNDTFASPLQFIDQVIYAQFDNNGLVTSVSLVGVFENQDGETIIPGERYVPLVFVSNARNKDLLVDLRLQTHYVTFGQADTFIATDSNPARHNYQAVPLGAFSIEQGKHYMIIPSRQMMFWLYSGGDDYFSAFGPQISLRAVAEDHAYFAGKTFKVSDTTQSTFADFFVVVDGDQVHVDASPSVSGTLINTYRWLHNGAEIGAGKNASFGLSDVEISPGRGELTLVLEGFSSTLRGHTKQFSTVGSDLLIAGRYEVIGADGGIIRDVETGLEWMRCSLGQAWTGSTCSGAPSVHTFGGAQTAAQSLNVGGGYGGYADWRVPSIGELTTLIYCSSGRPAYFDKNLGCYGSFSIPMIVSEVFPNTPNSGHWSGSPYGHDSNSAWTVHFGLGHPYYSSVGNLDHVRLVRGGH